MATPARQIQNMGNVANQAEQQIIQGNIIIQSVPDRTLVYTLETFSNTNPLGL